MRLTENYAEPAGVHSFQKIDGILALDRNEVVEEEELDVGDCIVWFSLPDGRLLLSKDPEGTPIERISSAYYHLGTDVTLEEK